MFSSLIIYVLLVELYMVMLYNKCLKFINIKNKYKTFFIDRYVKSKNIYGHLEWRHGVEES
jgi:hypothetical protein